MAHTGLMAALERKGADIDGIMARFLRDEALYADCLQEFVRDENFEALKTAIAIGDYPRAFECAHALKGVAGNLGLVPLYRAVGDITDALRAKRYDALDSLYPSVIFNRDAFLSVISQQIR